MPTAVGANALTLKTGICLCYTTKLIAGHARSYGGMDHRIMKARDKKIVSALSLLDRIWSVYYQKWESLTVALSEIYSPESVARALEDAPSRRFL